MYSLNIQLKKIKAIKWSSDVGADIHHLASDVAQLATTADGFQEKEMRSLRYDMENNATDSRPSVEWHNFAISAVDSELTPMRPRKLVLFYESE